MDRDNPSGTGDWESFSSLSMEHRDAFIAAGCSVSAAGDVPRSARLAGLVVLVARSRSWAKPSSKMSLSDPSLCNFAASVSFFFCVLSCVSLLFILS